MTELAAENYVIGESNVADKDDYKTGNGSVDYVVGKLSSQATDKQQLSSNTKQDDDEVEVVDAEGEEEEEEDERDRLAVGETEADAGVGRGEGGADGTQGQTEGRQLNYLVYFPGQDEPIRLFHNEISQDDQDDVCIFPNESLEQETLEVLLNSLHNTSFFNVPEDEEVVLDFFEHGLKISQV